MTPLDDKFLQPHPQTAGRLIGDEAVLILADVSEITVLNPVGARVFELADGRHTVADIIAHVVDEFDVERARAADDVVAFVDQMVAENVFVLADEAAA